eukprot:CAMPEP_0179254820 /NCGR_PEP_ID=MMETSP0797-20121207/23432_1 /TAXON_ID=47934 /ORGANISM="Dinophysis acuminata, Strain DAEP01" /LENGTH=200 /DNA_ID=CAMNT_0020962703 /DNA_START=43 /DNA_END=644 /DNA_ORIENTATION=-
MVSCRQRVARGSRGDETRSPHDNSTGLPRRGSSKSSDGMVLREAEKDIFWAELSLACQEKDQKDGSKPRWADIDVEDPLCVAADAVESWPQEGNESPTRVCVVVGRRQLGPRGGRKPKFPAATAAAEPTPAPYCKSSGDPGGSRPDGAAAVAPQGAPTVAEAASRNDTGARARGLHQGRSEDDGWNVVQFKDEEQAHLQG